MRLFLWLPERKITKPASTTAGKGITLKIWLVNFVCITGATNSDVHGTFVAAWKKRLMY
jgi:hypothetical protein